MGDTTNALALTKARADTLYAPIGGSGGTTNGDIVAWMTGESYAVLASPVATRTVTDALNTASVTWPDGATGTYALTTESTAFPGYVDAYVMTYKLGSAALKTMTQAALTRNATGGILVRPAVVFS